MESDPVYVHALLSRFFWQLVRPDATASRIDS